MSNAGAAREPSMDEILASIRRIIESGEDRPGIGPAARKPEPASNAAETTAGEDNAVARLVRDGAKAGGAGSPSHARPDPAPETGSGMPAAGSTRAAERTATEQTSEEAGRPMPSDLDHAARSVAKLRAVQLGAAEDAQDPAGPAALPEWPRSVSEQAPAAHRTGRTAEAPQGQENRRAVAAGNDVARQSATVVEMRNFGVEFDEAAFAAELLNETGLGWGIDGEAALAAAPEPSLPEERAQEAAGPRRFDNDAETSRPRPSMRGEAGLHETGTAPLMSSDTGRQVAAAFGDLSEAIRMGQMKSMEEMAREMLRPMLQEWLDDNLPRLVERLVREEIERVARGGR